MNDQASQDWLDAYLDQLVCADLKDGFVIYGTLESHDALSVMFRDADFHDPREANCSKEVYAIETKQIGVRANRKQCRVPKSNLIAISLLSDLC